MRQAMVGPARPKQYKSKLVHEDTLRIEQYTMKDRNSRLVYSTDQGRVKQPSKNAAEKPSNPKGDGIVRIRRETKGRKGKGVTCIDGLELEDKALKALAKELKQLCGTGGAIKAGIVEIQGDQREKIKVHLEAKGHTVKLSGG